MPQQRAYASAEQSWKGYWWLPDAPDEQYPGILYYAPYGDLRLELIGGFSVETRAPHEGGGYAIGVDGSWPLIHGLAEGTAFTLLDATATSTRGGFASRSIAAQTITSVRGLKDIQLAAHDEACFASMELEIEYLLGWTARTSMAMQLEFDGRWTGKQSVQSSPVDDLTATFEDVTITLRVPHGQFEFETAHSGNRRLISGREFAELEVTSQTPLSLDDLDKLAKALQDLMTFAAMAPAGVLRRTAYVRPTANGRAPRIRGIELLGRQVYEPGSAAEAEKRHHDYLFTLEQVDFAQVIPAWLAFHRQAWLSCSMLFGTKYSRAGYTPVRFLTIASAAEGLHRTLHDREPLDHAVFDQACATVLQAVGGPENKPVRALIREQLHNTLTYRQRLLELASLPDPTVVAELLPDIEAWVKLTKNTRNGVAHADDTKPGSRPDGLVIFWLTEITYYLVTLAILAELGIDVEVQRRVVNLPHVAFARRELAALIQSSTLESKR